MERSFFFDEEHLLDDNGGHVSLVDHLLELAQSDIRIDREVPDVDRAFFLAAPSANSQDDVLLCGGVFFG